MSYTPTADPRRGSSVDGGKVEQAVVGGGDAGVPETRQAPVYNKKGEVQEVDAAVVKAVDDFQVPHGHVRKGDRERSFMYRLGVYVEELEGEKHKYFCLADATCRRKSKMVPCKGGDRSNVNSHLKNAHGVQGMGGVVKQGKRKATQESIVKNLPASKKSGDGKDRVLGLLAAKWIVEKFLPFDFFSTGTTWQELVGSLTAHTTPFPALPSWRMKHLLVELYVATKQAVLGNMQEEIKKATLPIIHYGLDLWTCKISWRKYLSVHVSYVDRNFTLRHALLAVKHYAPSAAIQGTETATEVLFTIFRATLAENGIKLSDLAGGTTGSDPDVRAMCVDVLMASHKIGWDWCGCDLADKAAEYAFGISADPHNSNNRDAREVIKLVVKTAEKMNQSAAFKQMFEEVEVEALNDILKATGRCAGWPNLVRVMERIFRLWHVLRKVYADDGEEFLLDEDNNRDDVLQLYSLLQPLSAITRDSRCGDVPMTAEMHMAFAQLKAEVLDPDLPLRVFDIPPAPNSPEAEKDGEARMGREGGRPTLPSAMVPSDELRPVTLKTRKEISKALVERLFGRVWDEESSDPSPFRDAAVLLTPPFNTGKYLDALRLTAADAEHLPTGKRGLAPTPDAGVTAKLDACWGDIKTRAWGAARGQHRRSAPPVVVDGQPSRKRLRTEGSTCSPARMSRFAAFGRGEASGGGGGGAKDDWANSEDRKLGGIVAGEIERYKSLFMTAVELDCREVLSWWGRTGKNVFPCLAPVAQQVFGSQVAASQVEDRDFEGGVNFLTPNRSRMDAYWAEMVMFLKANFEHIPATKQIPVIATENIRSCLPARFYGRDPDLLAAEAALDILQNATIPTADDFGVED
ncbi:unnamed protein product [Ectocarpus sp. 8 AP-2014]